MDVCENNCCILEHLKIYEIHFSIILCSTSIYFPWYLLWFSGFPSKILINSASPEGTGITLSCNYVILLQCPRHDKPIDIREICAETWGFSNVQTSALQKKNPLPITLNMKPNTKFWREKIMDSPKQSITCCPQSWCLVNRKRLRHHGCKGRRNPVRIVPLDRTRKSRALVNTALCCQRIVQQNSGNLNIRTPSHTYTKPYRMQPAYYGKERYRNFSRCRKVPL